MPRTLLLVLFGALIATLAIAAVACGDEDDDDSSAEDSPTVTATESKETPAEDTGGPAADTVTPTAPPAASEGTPANEPEDANAFLDQFQGKHVEFRACAYNPATALVNCATFGVYAINPPITGQDITCQLWEVEEKPAAIQCQSAEPLQTRYYALQ